MRNNLRDCVSIRDKHRGVVRRPAITWLQWDRGDDGGRVAVGVLGGDVGDEVCLELPVALVDRRRVVNLRWRDRRHRRRPSTCHSVLTLRWEVRDHNCLRASVILSNCARHNRWLRVWLRRREHSLVHLRERRHRRRDRHRLPVRISSGDVRHYLGDCVAIGGVSRCVVWLFYLDRDSFSSNVLPSII